MGGIFPEGDQACQGGDEGTGTADVHAQEEGGVIGGELGQEDGRGHVTDDLAGQDADKQGILSHQGRKQLADGGDACHVTGKDKEAEEGSKECVIHLSECLSVKEKKRERDQNQSELIGDQTEDDDD